MSGSWKVRGSGWVFLLLRLRQKRKKARATTASIAVGTATAGPTIEARCFELEEGEGVTDAVTATGLVVEVNRVLAGDPPEVTIDVITRTLALVEVAELTAELADEDVSRLMDLSIGAVAELEAEAEDVAEELADVVAATEEADVEELAAEPEPEPPAMKGN